ncbi:MAG: hypothetical protein ACREM6_10755 [Vulcanimicrobiaceae bacterium]
MDLVRPGRTVGRPHPVDLRSVLAPAAVLAVAAAACALRVAGVGGPQPPSYDESVAVQTLQARLIVTDGLAVASAAAGFDAPPAPVDAAGARVRVHRFTPADLIDVVRQPIQPEFGAARVLIARSYHPIATFGPPWVRPRPPGRSQAR